jgi:hypothetical protein
MRQIAFGDQRFAPFRRRAPDAGADVAQQRVLAGEGSLLSLAAEA